MCKEGFVKNEPWIPSESDLSGRKKGTLTEVSLSHGPQLSWEDSNAINGDFFPPLADNNTAFWFQKQLAELKYYSCWNHSLLMAYALSGQGCVQNC